MRPTIFTRELNNLQKLAETNKLGRFLNNPFKYLNAILYRTLVYKRTKKEKEVSCLTFFNTKMKVLLPSSTDIYLTKGKTHNSEIRLARFMTSYLSKGDCFIDVGAHYGYFSLLAGCLVGEEGSVHAIEPTPSSFKVLSDNILDNSMISADNIALAEKRGEMMFYYFPNKYSEYNSFDVIQYQKEEWYKDNIPQEINVKCSTLDHIVEQRDIHPTMIKIDVEGAEHMVLKGGIELLEHQAPIIIMEFLANHRGNESHVMAEHFLVSRGYNPYRICENGQIEKIVSSSGHLDNIGSESDNIVYLKEGKENIKT